MTAAELLLNRLFEVSLVVADHAERGLADRGLTRPRAQVLWQLAEPPPMTQRELSERLGVSPRNVTGLIDGLEGSGHVRRASHPTDRRATLLELTDLGARVVTELRRDHRELAEQVFGGLAPRERRGFLAAVEHVLSRVPRRNLAGAGS